MNAFKIWVKCGPCEYQDVRGGFIKMRYAPVLDARARPETDFEPAVLALSGEMDKKRKEAVIFLPDKSAEPIKIDDETITAYRDQLTQEQKDLLGSDGGALRASQPIFYVMDEESLYFFGHTMMFRLPYGNSPRNFVPDRLRDENVLDLAEAIFGCAKEAKTGDSTKQALAGRVFFSDAKYIGASRGLFLSQDGCKDHIITPSILSSPKPTTFQHYLVQDETQGHSPDKGKELAHYGTPTPTGTVLRGHKFYWHRGNVGQKEIEEADCDGIDWTKDKQHTRFKPLRSEVAFRFRIRFENLRDHELGALLWVLRLPGEEGKAYRHKLGMGKPFGMGSVCIEPVLHLSDRYLRYVKLFEDRQWYCPDHEVKNVRPYLQSFEKYVLERMDSNERAEASYLGDVERIKVLLKMLEWPGPDSEATRYMEIKLQDKSLGGKGANEFSRRPVLPDPLNVEGLPYKATAASNSHAGKQGKYKRR